MTATLAMRSYLYPVGGKNYDTNASEPPNLPMRSHLCPVCGKNYDRWGAR